MSSTFFPTLVTFLFSDSQPSDFSDRSCILSLLISYLKQADPSQREHRSRCILSYLEEANTTSDKPEPEFIELCHISRPLKKWANECNNVVRDVFWIFKRIGTHIRLSPIKNRSMEDVFHKQTERCKIRMSSRVGISALECTATEYLASHIELINLLICSISSKSDRAELRQRLKVAGFEMLIGKYLRAVVGYSENLAINLEILVTVAYFDDWDTSLMRSGMQRDRERSRMRYLENDEPSLKTGHFIAEIPSAKSVLSDALFDASEIIDENI